MEKNMIVINDTLRRSLKSQMKDANRLKANYTLIVGEDEIKNKTLSENELPSLQKSFSYSII